jgi:hypothetical protein
LATTNLPRIQGSESEFCPYSGDVDDKFSANLDSSESIAISAGHVVLDFSSAYIHQSDGRPAIDAGTGWTQHAVIRVRGDVVSGSLTELPCDLSSGYLALNGQHSDNLIPIPLSCDGDVELHLTSAFGESVRACGNRVTLELLGEPDYVEQFPGADRA